VTLRLLEHYVSTQGEGPNVGKLTQFVRFAGCNLKCPGWPCDTPYAIEPRLFTKEQTLLNSYALAEMIRQQYVATGATNICLTGGEPLMQPQNEINQTIDWLDERFGFFRFEVFTNGTRPIDEGLADNCTFVMDWKLPGSGEDPDNQTRINNLSIIDMGINSVKFTIATDEDLAMASGIWTSHLMDSPLQVFAGAAWEKYDNDKIVKFMMERRLPWRLNVQVHNYVFGGPTKRGI
jgi:7-carboxy-7-deazaguanine synthase